MGKLGMILGLLAKQASRISGIIMNSMQKDGLVKEVKSGEPGSKVIVTQRHLYAGDQLKQTEKKVGREAPTYTYYTYNDANELIRIESKAANVSIERNEDGTVEIETLNHKHDYPALREELYDSLGRLVVQKDYRKSGLKKPILFKITHFAYDSLGRLTSTEDSTLKSVKDPDNWNIRGSEYEYDGLGREIRQTNKIVLFGEDYFGEKTTQHGEDGLVRSTHCSPPGFPPCKENLQRLSRK